MDDKGLAPVATRLNVLVAAAACRNVANLAQMIVNAPTAGMRRKKAHDSSEMGIGALESGAAP